MYILINKTTNESSIIKEKTTLSYLISKSVSTIYRNQSLKVWESGNFLIYNPQKVILKSQRGGKNNFKGGNDAF
jgi:hypothetical protein